MTARHGPIRGLLKLSDGLHRDLISSECTLGGSCIIIHDWIPKS
jgi:hypothetical protein